MARRIAAGARLVIASHNPGKVEEIAALLAPFGVATVAAAALGLPEPEETGDSFEANAALKARAAARRAGCRRWPTIPGSWCRRWAARRASIRRAGPGRRRISAPRWSGCERELGDKDRGASFVAVLALAWPDGADRDCSAARLHGRLTWPPRGDRGFGYDPMFVPRGRHDLRRDGPGREAPHQPPRPRLREAGAGVF